MASMLTRIWARDGGCCRYCGRKLSLFRADRFSPCRQQDEDATVDHLWPRSKGGRNIAPNCVLACAGCNRRKGSKTLEEAGMTLLPCPNGAVVEAAVEAFVFPDIAPVYGPCEVERVLSEMREVALLPGNPLHDLAQRLGTGVLERVRQQASPEDRPPPTPVKLSARGKATVVPPQALVPVTARWIRCPHKHVFRVTWTDTTWARFYGGGPVVVCPKCPALCTRENLCVEHLFPIERLQPGDYVWAEDVWGGEYHLADPHDPAIHTRPHRDRYRVLRREPLERLGTPDIYLVLVEDRNMVGYGHPKRLGVYVCAPADAVRLTRMEKGKR